MTKLLKNNIYRGEWSSKDDLLGDFDSGLTQDELNSINIIYASYETGSYDGESFVLFEKEGKLFESNSYHCSCNGLYWDPEETTLESILCRDTDWIKDFKECMEIGHD